MKKKDMAALSPLCFCLLIFQTLSRGKWSEPSSCSFLYYLFSFSCLVAFSVSFSLFFCWLAPIDRSGDSAVHQVSESCGVWAKYVVEMKYFWRQMLRYSPGAATSAYNSKNRSISSSSSSSDVYLCFLFGPAKWPAPSRLRHLIYPIDWLLCRCGCQRKRRWEGGDAG